MQKKLKARACFIVLNAKFAPVIFSLFCAFHSQAQISQKAFENPPQNAQPWVYWMWVNGNVSKESVTKDLEAMHKVGIGGALALDVDQQTPQGNVKYMDKNWLDIFGKTVAEAKRLGMEISTNNGPGYWGSGGKWVKPEMGMQWVVSSETYLKGGKPWKGKLPLPSNRAEYKDIAVIAVGVIDTNVNKRFFIPDFPLKSLQFPGNAGTVNYAGSKMTLKALQWPGFPRYLQYRGTQSAPPDAEAPAAAIIPRNKVMDITRYMTADGTLTWDAPAGEWTVIRFGHQFTGSSIGPVIDDVLGPETDKLSKEATRYHFNEMVKKLNEQVGPQRKGTLVSTHIDSWEGGGQNWTPGMDKVFKQKRGYDIVPYLPVLTGRIIGSLQETERFLYDLRTTVSELFVENYAQEFQKLAKEAGLQLSFESYTGIGNDMNAANYVDVPMAEYWIPVGWSPNFNATKKSMASAAHLNGHEVVAAEALTASDSEKWLYHPAKFKYLVDEAFCDGINRMVFHRYSAQYFNVQGPGIQMGPWGTHYERTNTWWDFSKPWNDYVARCQYLLRQGIFRADVLDLLSEEPLSRFQKINLSGYDYDVLGSDAFKKLTVSRDGLHIPNRPAYKLLLLSHNGTMSVEMLRKIRDLVKDGAAILGNPPKATPGLLNYKEENAELKKLVDELWTEADHLKEHPVGKGMVFRDMTTEETLLRLGVAKDFDANQPLKYIHRTDGDKEVYFVANTTSRSFTARCTFRVAGKQAQIWDAETGKAYTIHPEKSSVKGASSFTIPFDGSKSYFVVFGSSTNKSLPALPLAQQFIHPVEITGGWTLSFPKGWGAPDKIEWPKLSSWSENKNEGVRYFSGTARYHKTIVIDKNNRIKGAPLMLDLGRVEVMARVILNGKDLGIAWRPPFLFDITTAAKEGKNNLEIDVVNLWPNRLIGDDKLPDDSHFKNGVMQTWPDWLLNNKQRPTPRKAFTTRRLWKAEDELLPSGLLGPVRVGYYTLSY